MYYGSDKYSIPKGVFYWEMHFMPIRKGPKQTVDMAKARTEFDHHFDAPFLCGGGIFWHLLFLYICPCPEYCQRMTHYSCQKSELILCQSLPCNFSKVLFPWEWGFCVFLILFSSCSRILSNFSDWYAFSRLYPKWRCWYFVLCFSWGEVSSLFWHLVCC